RPDNRSLSSNDQHGEKENRLAEIKIFRRNISRKVCEQDAGRTCITGAERKGLNLHSHHINRCSTSGDLVVADRYHGATNMRNAQPRGHRYGDDERCPKNIKICLRRIETMPEHSWSWN